MTRVPTAFGESPEERIQVKAAPGHPKLTLVARDGDPVPGVAAAVVVDAAPQVTLALALIVETRMGSAGFRVGRRVDREAFFVTTYASGKELGAFFAATVTALKTPISQAELAAAETRLHALGPLPNEPAELALVNRCIGKLAVPNDQPPTLNDVEHARLAAFVDGRVSFAVVGGAASRTEAEHAFEETPEWPKGSLPAAEVAPPRKSSVGRALMVPRSSVRVTVAWPVADARTSATSAARLGEPLSPLRAKLDRLRVPFAIDEVGGVTKPHGGCIFVTATSHPIDSQTDVGPAAGLASALIEAELGNVMNERTDTSLASREVLRASDPVDSATIAAWWALSSPMSAPPGLATSVALLDPEASDASVTAARDALARATSPAKATATLRARAELGQEELWMALADPCAVAEEPPHQWGTAALVALATGLQTPELDGVAIEPLVDGRGMGVFAHSGPRKGESATDLADRVAGAAAKALLGKPVTSEGLLEAQSTVRGVVERAWGRETLGLVPFAEALAPEHPALVEPLGSFAQVSRSDPERAARRWRSLGASGITLGILTNGGDSQSARAQEIVGRWLTGGASSACAQSSPVPRPGRAEVHGSGVGHNAWLLFGIPTDQDALAPVARALLDEQAPANLMRAALTSVPGATVRVWTSGGLLIIATEAPDELVDTAEKALRDVVGRMARGEIPEVTLRSAARDAEATDLHDLADPKTRLRRLLFGGALEPAKLNTPDLPGRFKAFAAKAFADRRWVVVVAHPS